MYSPVDAMTDFYEHIDKTVEELSFTIDTRLSLNASLLADGESFEFFADEEAEIHLDLVNKGYYEKAKNLVLNRIAKGYREQGWKVEVIYDDTLIQGQNCLKFSSKEQDA